MKSKIIGEDNKDIGTKVTDNNDVVHQIEMHKSNGEIYAHEQEGYPDDPAERTIAGNEHVNQARRFAKYWVYRERGYETLEWRHNPNRITAAAIAIAPLGADAASEYLGDFAQQFDHIHGDARPAVSVPDAAQPAYAVYQKDIYVGFEDQALGSLVGDLLGNDDVMAALGRAIDPTAARPDDAAFSAALAEITGKDSTDVPSLSDGCLLEAVSDLHVLWDDAAGQYHTQWGEQPDIERDPHARIEIFEFDPDSIVELKCQIARHLLCQVRDCYLGMGIAPPEPFRLLGAGHHGAGTRYEHYEFYDRYHDPTADISTWYEEYTPDNAYDTSLAAIES